MPSAACLAAGGRFVFACWQDVERNPWHVGTALRPLLPPPPIPPPGKSPVGPFVLGDDEYVRDLLGGAGFAAVEGTPHETTVRAPADAVVDRSLLPFMGVSPEDEDEALEVVERHLGAVRRRAGRLRVPAGFQGLRGRQRLAGQTPCANPGPVAGYSGTPLPKKLGITEGRRLRSSKRRPG